MTEYKFEALAIFLHIFGSCMYIVEAKPAVQDE